jgi:hypothetical protein
MTDDQADYRLKCRGVVLPRSGRDRHEEPGPEKVIVEYQPFGAAARPSLADILTRSGKKSAFIFYLTLPRCAFTDIEHRLG